MPGGHLATSLALGGVAYASSGSIEAATGCLVGGFLIDADHYLDYLVFEKQWRRAGPISFLRYYFTYCPKKLVLPLHSFEFMTLLLLVILEYPWPVLVGYWVGALMHLIFDIIVNGDHAIKHAGFFYFFSYRAAHRFDAEKLLVVLPVQAEGRTTIRDFFRWQPLKDPTEVSPPEFTQRIGSGVSDP